MPEDHTADPSVERDAVVALDRSPAENAPAAGLRTELSGREEVRRG
ncbi:hypothetical protein NGM10_16455 (plasmid) [Halorussus salilacus]|nr:hypothetical protein [Halorussus salilacus]USZ69994.1 hypothetical protein NGM10_16455 [Halorussus salilacus]